jgi:hypothetical protein
MPVELPRSTNKAPSSEGVEVVVNPSGMPVVKESRQS